MGHFDRHKWDITAGGNKAQQSPSPDSLVAHFLEHGAASSWLPYKLFEGCPDLEAWQERGIELVLTAELTLERTKDLAFAWIPPLRGCRDARVERWYFEQIDAAIQRDDPEGILLAFWWALQLADSPGIREYLRTLMLDESKPESYRSVAGATLFGKFDPEEYLREYLRAFETMRMPFEVQVGQTHALLKRDADRLLGEVGRLVRMNPELADQGAFTQIVESSDRYASAAARRGLGEALRAGLAGSGLTGRARGRLEGAVQFLMRPAR